MGSSYSRPAQATMAIVKSENANEKQQLADLQNQLGSFSLATRASTSSTGTTCAAPTPASPDGSLPLQSITTWETSLAMDPKQRLARTVLYHTDLHSVLTARNVRIKDAHVFNTLLADTEPPKPVTSQKNTGRCWLFATTNILRYKVIERLGLEEFQLSQSHLFFWDKLNKANYYLELMIELFDLPFEDRLICFLSDSIISDGGQWDMAVNLLENYGVVPQAIYPESLHSSLSAPLNSLLKTKLREHALVLRQLAQSLSASAVPGDEMRATLRAKKEAFLKDVYTIMTATFGVPLTADTQFVWEYKDKKGVAGRWEGTPKEFYRAFIDKAYPPSDSFSLIHDPRNEYSKLYTVDKLGNIWGGRPVLYVNAEIEILKSSIVKMIKAGQPVFFGCDVGKFSEQASGIMDVSLFEYENAFDIKLGLTKAERLYLGESSMSHAMVISGVHVDVNGRPVRYKVENSWGKDVGDHGYFVMTDAWFNEFVYQVVVPKAMAPKELVKVFEKGEKVVLPPWDPMGTLA